MQPDISAAAALAHIGAQGQQHSLHEHLTEVARLAADNAASFDCGSWARLAGLWHDLGKYRHGFQTYIRRANDTDAHIEGRIGGYDKTHSAAGARWAQQYLGERLGNEGKAIARVLSYLIAGHHAGLDNWSGGSNGGLNARFAKSETDREFSDAMLAQPPHEILEPDFILPQIEKIPVDDRNGQPPGAFALWVRILFSCLVDADFLDTEQFLDGSKFASRAGYPSIGDMAQQLERHMASKLGALRVRGDADSVVNRTRASVLGQCRQKALLPSGVFTLTVPTGGGKTLSSLAFALTHATQHAKRRVIYAIPFTSIIEQTAEIFRDIFGDGNVVEHHSNVESDEGAETQRSRLACENWDAPLIVTTNVQLFESLFARKTSRCRKLHNLVGSVIVLDEAQLLPVEFLQPILDVLGLLVRSYGVTLVLCTATQPSLTSQESFTPKHRLRGFAASEITEIVDHVSGLYSALKRVKVHRPQDLDQKREWAEIGNDIAGHDGVLAIVNRRKDAAELYRLLRCDHPDGLFHLSGLMCAQHRSDTIAAIKQALQAYRSGAASPVRVVSTQLVEAGVDLDFPVVYRAMAGLDSIAQAAGRCNREGRLPQGDVFVFVPPTSPPSGLLRQAESECRSLWRRLPETHDPIDVSLYGQYFRRLYAQDLDKKGICSALKMTAGEVCFRDAAEAFKLIDDDDGVSVLVRYRTEGASSDIDRLVRILEAEGPHRWLMRKLQRYLVTIYRRDAVRLLKVGDIRCIDRCPGLHVQVSDALYDAHLGLLADGAPGDPAGFVC
jgi:CRISPR-associated endonuclease/helicase Cas3